jgi:hypothetical protein
MATEIRTVSAVFQYPKQVKQNQSTVLPVPSDEELTNFFTQCAFQSGEARVPTRLWTTSASCTGSRTTKQADSGRWPT